MIIGTTDKNCRVRSQGAKPGSDPRSSVIAGRPNRALPARTDAGHHRRRPALVVSRRLLNRWRLSRLAFLEAHHPDGKESPHGRSSAVDGPARCQAVTSTPIPVFASRGVDWARVIYSKVSASLSKMIKAQGFCVFSSGLSAWSPRGRRLHTGLVVNVTRQIITPARSWWRRPTRKGLGRCRWRESPLA